MNHIKLLCITAPALACALFSGCSSDGSAEYNRHYNMPLFDRMPNQSIPQQHTYLASTPDKASVMLNGAYVGTTPAIDMYARYGDSITIYKPGYDAAFFSAKSDGPVDANIPLFPSNSRYYSLLSEAGARFVQSGNGTVLEATGARADAGSSFVIYDRQRGGDVRLNVLESNWLFLRFKAEDGAEFCYPVLRQPERNPAYVQNQYNREDARIGSAYPAPVHKQAKGEMREYFPQIQSGLAQPSARMDSAYR